MSRYLVIGDSFAYYDPKHSHWLKIWAEKNHSTTTHIGCCGSNSVNITNQVKDMTFSRYDAVFYHPTHLLRTEMKHPDWSYDNSIANETSNLNLDFITKPKKIVDGKLMGINEVSKSDIHLDEFIKLSYKNTVDHWLARANYYSMCYLFELIKKTNVPILSVTSFPDKQWEYEMPDTVDYKINLSKIFLKSEEIFKIVEFCNESLNHWSLEDHNNIAEQFNFFVQKDNVIKTLLNK